MAVTTDITGMRFGQLVALNEVERDGRHRQWQFQCDCGKVIIKRKQNVTGARGARSCSIQCARNQQTAQDVGRRWNRLVYLRHVGDKKAEYQCDCGEKTVKRTDLVRSGAIKSCGCWHREVLAEQQQEGCRNDLTGMIFGRLTAISYASSSSWNCKCSCGGTAVVGSYQLTSGATRSCGCLVKETAVQNFRNEGHEAYALHPDYAERSSFVYLVEVGGTVDKIGIAFDIAARSKTGDYTEIWWKRQMTRAQCWAVEQAALHLTREYAPEQVYTNKHDNCGTSEQRVGWVIEDVIGLLEQLCDECLDMGWEAFYSRYLT